MTTLGRYTTYYTHNCKFLHWILSPFPLVCQTAQFNVEHFSGMHNWYACSHARPTFCNVCKDSLSGVTSHGLSCEGKRRTYRHTVHNGRMKPLFNLRKCALSLPEREKELKESSAYSLIPNFEIVCLCHSILWLSSTWRASRIQIKQKATFVHVGPKNSLPSWKSPPIKGVMKVERGACLFKVEGDQSNQLRRHQRSLHFISISCSRWFAGDRSCATEPHTHSRVDKNFSASLPLFHPYTSGHERCVLTVCCRTIKGRFDGVIWTLLMFC